MKDDNIKKKILPRLYNTYFTLLQKYESVYLIGDSIPNRILNMRSVCVRLDNSSVKKYEKKEPIKNYY